MGGYFYKVSLGARPRKSHFLVTSELLLYFSGGFRASRRPAASHRLPEICAHWLVTGKNVATKHPAGARKPRASRCKHGLEGLRSRPPFTGVLRGPGLKVPPRKGKILQSQPFSAHFALFSLKNAGETREKRAKCPEKG